MSLDLLAPGAHLLVYGEPGSGRSTLLTRVVSWLSATRSPTEVRLHLVDPARSQLAIAGLPQVAGYAYERDGLAGLASDLAARLDRRRPPPGLSFAQLADRSWWRGPEHVLVVDDFDRLVQLDGGPLSVLAEPLSAAVELGWHVVLARRVAGAGRGSYDPFGQRLRDAASAALVLSGEPSEGRIFGAVTPATLPPGRGVLVRAGRADALVQLYLPAAGTG